jgi:hypothetical protein
LDFKFINNSHNALELDVDSDEASEISYPIITQKKFKEFLEYYKDPEMYKNSKKYNL